MEYKTVGLLLVFLVIVQGSTALFLSYGLNGKYFKETPYLGEAIRNLRRDKPRTAMVIGILYFLCVAELLLGILYNIGRH